MRSTRFTAVIAAMALAFVSGAFVSGPATGHSKLVSSTPSANSTVAKPARIILKFNEKIISKMTGAELVMTGMPGMADHAPMKIAGFTSQMGADGKSVTLLLKRPLVPGTYKVSWHTAGADTHHMGGNFSFTVK